MAWWSSGTQRAAEDSVAVTNPALLLEVTSNSSEDYDRGEKLRQYQAIATAREVLIVSHREPRITLHRRDASGWHSTEARSGESLALQSIGGTLNVDDVYRDGLEDAARG